METINTKIPGGRLASDLQLNGVAEGDLIVPAGLHLHLNGTAAKNVTVEEGGSADINGVIIGALRNHGGRVIVRGVVQGGIENSETAVTDVDPNAIVMGRRR